MKPYYCLWISQNAKLLVILYRRASREFHIFIFILWTVFTHKKRHKMQTSKIKHHLFRHFKIIYTKRQLISLLPDKSVANHVILCFLWAKVAFHAFLGAWNNWIKDNYFFFLLKNAHKTCCILCFLWAKVAFILF